MAFTEQLANKVATTLVSSIGANDTSMNVAATTYFPSAASFYLVIDAEIVQVTAVAGAFYTISRGQLGTVAAAHSAGVAVTHVSTLAAGITALSTSLNVDNAIPYPTVPQFRLLIDAEIVLVTAVSGTTFTISRGQESTTAAAHANGSAVTPVLTNGAMLAVCQDPNRALNGTANNLAAGQGLLLSTGWQENLANGSECRLRLFMSGDMGKSWNTVYPDYVYKDPADTNTYFAPLNGQLRDATFGHYGDKYFTAYTNDYGGTKQQFSIASATDLLNWTWLQDFTLPVGLNAFRVRAPEFFFDTDGSVYTYFTFSTGASQTNDQIYFIKATDSPATFTNWTTPTAVGYGAEPAFCIDPFMLKVGSTYYLFYKNATTNQCEVASSSSPTTGFTLVNNAVTPNTGNFEGYSVIQTTPGTYRLFTDKRTDLGYFYTDSSDGAFATWTAPVAVVAPYVWQHGTVVRVMDQALWRHINSAHMAGSRVKGSNMTLTNNVSIPNNAFTAITFTGAYLDELGAFQAGTPTRFTAPSSAWYSCYGHLNWDNNTTGQRLIDILINGSTAEVIRLGATPTTAQPGPDMACGAPTFLNVGDYIELRAYQNSGGALNAQNCNMLMMRQGGY